MITILLLLIGLHCLMGLKYGGDRSKLACGLWGGASSSLSNFELERIGQLGIISQLRGTDSTGVFTCFKQHGKIAVKPMKDVCNSSDFIYSQEFVDHIKDTRPFIVAGHCRDATVGVVNYENAHPYNLGKIVGMKNGTVPSVPGKLADETDSKALLRLLQEEGVEVAAKVADKGGCALVWADTRDLTLNFYRNIGRPLWIMEANGTIYWASEHDMLQLVRVRTNIKYTDAKIEMLPIETHRKYSMLYMLADPVDTKITVRTPVPYNVGQKPTEKKPVEKETTLVVDTAPFKATSVPITRQTPAILTTQVQDRNSHEKSLFKVKGFNGLTMTSRVARDILAQGCAHCADVISINDVEKVKMFTKKAYLCSKCAGDPFAIMQVGAHNKTLYQCHIITGKTDGNC
jgi:hypothetical protein